MGTFVKRPPLFCALVFCALSASCASTQALSESSCKRDLPQSVAFVYDSYESLKANTLKEGDVFKARASLEDARVLLYVSCRAHKERSSFRTLQKNFDAAEALVLRLEQARGVFFVSVRAERDLEKEALDFEYKDKNGRTLSEQEARAL